MKTLIAATALLLAGTAQAVTWTSSPGAPDPGPLANELYVIDFDAPLPADASLTGDYWIRNFTHVDHATPAGDASYYLIMSSANGTGTATLTFPTMKTASFYWGSIDSFNFVDVLGIGGTTLLSLSGADLPPDNGNQTDPQTNRRIFFAAGPNERITGFRFSSTGVAYELDTVAGEVPEPATWGLMIAGFAMVGFAMRNRRTSVVAA